MQYWLDGSGVMLSALCHLQVISIQINNTPVRPSVHPPYTQTPTHTAQVDKLDNDAPYLSPHHNKEIM